MFVFKHEHRKKKKIPKEHFQFSKIDKFQKGNNVGMVYRLISSFLPRIE